MSTARKAPTPPADAPKTSAAAAALPAPVSAPAATPAAPAARRKAPRSSQPKAAAKTPAKAKPAVKSAAKPVAKSPAKPAAAPALVKPAAKPLAKAFGQGATEKPAKAKKPKLVRDSFTIPKTEYVVIDELKARAAKIALPVKKSELLRAGIKALAAMDELAFAAALRNVPAIKTGRPKGDKA